MRPKGRVPSLLAWGLLVGGVALLITFPAGTPPRDLGAGQLPGAFLFTLAGFVFGVSHPEGRVWAGAALLGWVPAVAGVVVALDGAVPVETLLALALLPALLSAAGAWLGAIVARRRVQAD